MFGALQSKALRNGVLGGSGIWTAAWVLIVGIRILKRLRSPRPELLLSHRMRPGEEILIRGLAPKTTHRVRRRKWR